MLIPSLTESIRREISQEKKELIDEKKRSKSIEQERQRIERLKEKDLFAYEEAMNIFKEKTNRHMKDNDATNRFAQALKLRIMKKRPSLFMKASEQIEVQRKMKQLQHKKSTFKVADKPVEEDDAYFQF